MTVPEFLASIGINSTVLTAGGLGGVLRAMSRKRFTFREMIAAPVCGALAAAYLTIPLVHYVKSTGWPLPDDQQAILAAAFLIGTGAMWLADIVFLVIAKFFRIKGADE